jgi:hypothetical protein
MDEYYVLHFNPVRPIIKYYLVKINKYVYIILYVMYFISYIQMMYYLLYISMLKKMEY